MEVHMKAQSDDMVHSFAAVKLEMICVITVCTTGEAISVTLVSDEYYIFFKPTPEEREKEKDPSSIIMNLCA